MGIKDQLESITDLLTNTKIKEYKYENSYKGNPSKIITNGESKNLLWEGRRLKQIGDLKFTYNENGLRIKKETSSYDEEYILDGHKIIRLIHRSVDINYSLDFHYDEQGSIIGVHCNGKEYLYVKDTTGNISKIIDESGRTMVKYTYNAWGEFKKTIYTDGFISQYNPFIYKGYFYDSETNWYYLNNRYYDPSIKRFISADECCYLDEFSLLGINLYQYCNNNPVMYFDPSGHLVIAATGLLTGLLAILAATTIIIVVAAGALLIEEVCEYLSDNFVQEKSKIETAIKTYVFDLKPKKDYPNKTEKHHIVAKRDRRAKFSQVILRLSGIGINDERNIVEILKKYHKVLHTNAYYILLNSSMITVFVLDGTNGVLDLLKKYKEILGGLK